MSAQTAQQLFTGVLKKNFISVAAPAKVSQTQEVHNSPGHGATARIISQTPGQVIVEVLCQCGQRMELKCQYQV